MNDLLSDQQPLAVRCNISISPKQIITSHHHLPPRHLHSSDETLDVSQQTGILLR